jgi:hypothetical protein
MIVVGSIVGAFLVATRGVNHEPENDTRTILHFWQFFFFLAKSRVSR